MLDTIIRGGIIVDGTLVMVEHDMDLVFEFAQRITVLVNGAVLVEGNPAQIEQNEQVRAVYLGHGEATA